MHLYAKLGKFSQNALFFKEKAKKISYYFTMLN